jgi:plastocyanin
VQLTSLVVAGALFANTCCFSTGPTITGQPRCGAKMGGGGRATTAAITIGDNFFNPASVTVSRDSSRTATVTWTWAGRNPHSVTFDAGGRSSGVQRAGTFTRSFDRTGSFTYFCTVHGRAIMSGMVTVQ